MTQQIPEDLRYSNKHIWARADGNEVTMGVTKYATKLLRDDPPDKEEDIQSTILSTGETKPKAEPFGICKNETKGMDLINPLSYRLIERNFRAIEDPAIVGHDPYGEGWLVRVEMLEPGELDEMFSPEQYMEYTATNIPGEPEQYYYSRNHIWAKEDEGGGILMGITDYAVKLLRLFPAVAQINGVELGVSGNPVEPFGFVTSQIHHLQLISPFVFATLEQNQEVLENPAIIGQDPYENGWLIKAEIADIGMLYDLFTPEQYREYLGE